MAVIHSERSRVPVANGAGRNVFETVGQGSRLLAIQRLLAERQYVARKIRNLPLLEPRFRLEKPPTTIEDFLHHLQARKSVIDKDLRRYGRDSKHGKALPNRPNAQGAVLVREPRQVSIEEILRRQQEYPVSMTDRSQWLQELASTESAVMHGKVRPCANAWGVFDEEESEICRDSSYDYGVVVGNPELPASFRYDNTAWLNDDAAWWRDDREDTAVFYDRFGMRLPEVKVDSRVCTSMCIRSSGGITSLADDFNLFSQGFGIDHTDPNGNLVEPFSFQEYACLFSVADETVWIPGQYAIPELSAGARFDTGWITAVTVFEAKAGTVPVVRIAPKTCLLAQDGTLRIDGTWELTDLSYYIEPT